MNNRLTETGLFYKAALIALAVILASVLCAASIYQFRRVDPYVQDVLSLTGDSVQGQIIFQLNCAGCHGVSADGLVGPNLHHVSSRKSPTRIIRQVISGDTPPMPQFQPSSQAMADLLEYLNRL
ncbi:MAG: cytochrome c [Leptolyngbyaceae cyanobacterium CRU_2_3]|nr:cytochrome c [Leptolyngbyaceae cyanobacterium CRU_2_3]